VANPPAGDVILLHHSTGAVIWGGGVSAWVDSYNSAHSTSYAISELAYPDSPYPWQNYAYDYWHLWVQGGGQAETESVPTLCSLAQAHQVIVFKHCFPMSGIEADGPTPDITSEDKTVANYKLQYGAIKARLHEFPNNLFIVWTGAALRIEDSNAEQGARAREFFTWVKEQWDEPGDNIFVWDFFELETEGTNFLTPAHASTDSHPNDTFAQEVAPLFGQRLVNVLEGNGDSTSLTGQ